MDHEVLTPDLQAITSQICVTLWNGTSHSVAEGFEDFAMFSSENKLPDEPRTRLILDVICG